MCKDKDRKKNNFKALKRYGQNFLIDDNILNIIISSSDLNNDDVILEIGPGHGVLTRKLLNNNIKFVHAVEIDTRFKSDLDGLELDHENLKVNYFDAMKFNYLELDPVPNKIIANIPYNITTPLIWKLLGFGFKNFILMVQEESALRITAPENTKLRYPLGIAVEASGRAEIIKKVSRKCFRPVPKVNSAILKIEINKNFDLVKNSGWNKFLHEAFRFRRKKLTNNLNNLNIEILKNLEISPDSRAEDLSGEDWLKLFKILEMPK